MSCTPKFRGRVWLLHGFNVKDGGDGSIDKLKPALEAADFEVLEFEYGWTFLLGAKLLTKRMGKLLAKLVRPGDCVIAHSNGCCVAQIAAERGARFGTMVFISPALDRDAAIPEKVGERHVWFTPSDEWVGKARWIPWVRWGDMGSRGYWPADGEIDPRNINMNGEIVLGVRPLRHSGWFAEGLIKRTAETIVGMLLYSHLRATGHVEPSLLPKTHEQ